jgi:hypothetical protein
MSDKKRIRVVAEGLLAALLVVGGLLLAMVITIGSLWGLLLGMRYLVIRILGG